MLIMIEKWYDRLLVFLGLNILLCVICYMPFLLEPYDSLALLPWICIPLVAVIVIGLTIKQTIQRMGILRFLFIFLTVLISNCAVWIVLLGIAFFIVDKLTSWNAVFIVFISPIMTSWSLACFMLLALWPFTPKSSKSSKRWSKIASFIVNGPSKHKKELT